MKHGAEILWGRRATGLAYDRTFQVNSMDNEAGMDVLSRLNY